MHDLCLVPNLILSSFTPPSRINATLFDRSPLHFTIFLTHPSSSVTFLTSLCYLNSVCIIANFFLSFASCSCASRSSLRLHFTASSSSFHHFPSRFFPNPFLVCVIAHSHRWYLWCMYPKCSAQYPNHGSRSRPFFLSLALPHPSKVIFSVRALSRTIPKHFARYAGDASDLLRRSCRNTASEVWTCSASTGGR